MLALRKTSAVSAKPPDRHVIISEIRDGSTASLAANREAERELILLCSQTQINTAGVNRLQKIAAGKLCWDYIFKTSHRNGVLPQICKNLSKHCGGILCSEIIEKIAATSARHARNNLLLTRKLLEIVQLLESAEIDVLPFKGPTLALSAYGDVSLRQFVDLDILVKPKDFERAVSLIESNGFQIFGSRATITEKKGLIINRRKDTGFLSNDGSTRLELHWKLSGSYFALPFNGEDLWTRLKTLKFGGIRIKTLAFTDLFVYLCLHGGRHGFERLAWICDLRETLCAEKRKVDKTDWNKIIRRAREAGCLRLLELGVYLVEEMLKTDTGYPDIKAVKDNKIFKEISCGIEKKIFAEEFETTEVGDWYRYHLLLKEKPGDRLKLHLYYLTRYFRLAFNPTRKDKAAFRLPAVFSPLYVVLRPLRLLSLILTSKSREERK